MHFSFVEGVADVTDLVDTFVAFWLLIVDRANQRLSQLGVTEGTAYSIAPSAGYLGGTNGVSA
jgi:hypothetical protein